MRRSVVGEAIVLQNGLRRAGLERGQLQGGLGLVCPRLEVIDRLRHVHVAGAGRKHARSLQGVASGKGVPTVHSQHNSCRTRLVTNDRVPGSFHFSNQLILSPA